jgi:hypothetical protein
MHRFFHPFFPWVEKIDHVEWLLIHDKEHAVLRFLQKKSGFLSTVHYSIFFFSWDLLCNVFFRVSLKNVLLQAGTAKKWKKINSVFYFFHGIANTEHRNSIHMLHEVFTTTITLTRYIAVTSRAQPFC